MAIQALVMAKMITHKKIKVLRREAKLVPPRTSEQNQEERR